MTRHIRDVVLAFGPLDRAYRPPPSDGEPETQVMRNPLSVAPVLFALAFLVFVVLPIIGALVDGMP